MKNFALIFSLLFFMIACERNSEMEYIDSMIRIDYVNNKGVDLLNKNTVNSIDSAGIDIFYLKDGEKIRIYDKNMDMPESFRIDYDQSLSKYYLNLQLSHYMVNDISETYIEFNGDVDTVKCEYKITDNGYYHQKVWYNGILKINSDSWTDRFEIIK